MVATAIQSEQIQQYQTLQEEHAEDAASLLAQLLELPDYRTEARSAVRLDYFAYAMQFAKDSGMGPIRTNSLLSIASNLLDATAAGASFADVEASFKAQMLGLTSPKPGADTPLFSADQVAHIARFFTRTFFRHHRLYSFVFTCEQELTECSASLLVDTACVPSFEGAVPEDEWLAAKEAMQREAEAAAARAEQEQIAAEQAAQAAAAAAAAAEAERLRQEQLARKPATLEEAIEHLVAVRLEDEKKVLQADYAAKETILLTKIQQLEGRAQSPPLSGRGR